MDELILSKLGVKSYEELNESEKATFDNMVRTLEGKTLTLENVRDYVHQLKNAIIDQLIKEPEYTNVFIFKVLNRQHVFLKARLRNIVLIDNMIHSPVKAKKSLESYLANIKK